MITKKWIYKEGNAVKNFLASKGFNTKEEASAYLNFDKSQLRTNYLDMDKVVNRIADAIENKENITIYGDYDCDGICGTSIMLLALRRIGVNANFFINNRFSEGYGMNENGVARLIEKFPETELIVTVDNGIAAQLGIKAALDAAIDVVCTDHHLQKGDIIVPTVDEWRVDEDENAREESCGAEIARRTMLALYKKLNRPQIDLQFIDDLITFSGIATVADVVKFTAANRCIVKICIDYLNNPVFPIINLIKNEMRLDDIDEETLGFKLGPLMNCLSRVTGSPDEMVEILTSERNSIETYEKVRNAVETNETRKKMSDENFETAMFEINDLDECIILSGDYDPGIAGLVCSSVVERYNKPCICLHEEDGILKGSARSFLNFHLKEALDKCADLLIGYGGHAGAAGLTLREENLEAFQERMNTLVKESGILDSEVNINIDYKCSVSDMYDETVQALMSLAPFGEGFEKPKIVYTGGYKTVSFTPKDAETPKHVSLTLKDKTGECKAVWWNSYDKWTTLNPASKAELEIMGAPHIDFFNDKYYRKLYVDDIRIKE